VLSACPVASAPPDRRTSLSIEPTGNVLHDLILAFEAECGPPLEQDVGYVHPENR
jgi:hypothetical protein